MIKNPLSDSAPESTKMFGFYRGVVEDNNDPLEAGRVRARIFGIHTSQLLKDTTKGIPVNELPWSEPCLPIAEGSVSGFGMWGIPLQGSHVMIFFENGNVSQPRYFATMPGIPESKESLDTESGSNLVDASSVEGFQDPDGEYPLESRLGEPDVNRLARGETDDTLVQTKNNNRDLSVPEALGGGSWDEPVSPYAAKYPHNLVMATHGGLTVELDSTPNAARLNFYHPSNSYVEIDNDGVMVIKNNDKKYEIILSDNNIHIKRDRNLTIDNDSRVFVKGNEYEETTGNKTIQIDGNVEKTIDGNVNETIGGDEERDISGNVDETIQGNRDGHIVGGGNVQVDGVLNITVNGLVTITGNSGVLVTGGNIEVEGGSVKLGSQDVMRQLIDERLIATFNTHQHSGVTGGSSNSHGPRASDLLTLATHATANVEAS